MTESTCLHIQDRESGPIRVVELPWISVRIGRAAHCEVRLTEHDLPDEVCRLQRRGQSWRLLPAQAESPVLIEGRRPGGSCLLPFNLPFRVGQYCLTLRQDRAAEPDWEIYSGPAQKQPAEAQIRIEAGHSTADQPGPPRSHERWDSRWKALGAHVKARAERNRLGPEIKRPAYPSEFEPVPVREPRIPLIQPAVSRPIQPAAATIPTPGAIKVEPAWARAKAEIPWRAHPADLMTAPASSQQPWPDPIVRETPVQRPQSQGERIDLDDHVPPAQDKTPVETEPVSPAPAPEDASIAAASAALPESVIEPNGPLSPTAEIDHPSSFPLEPKAAKEVEWPSARDILATHRAARPRRAPATTRAKGRKTDSRLTTIPTVARAPAHWAPPVWLAGPAAAVFVLLTSLAACGLSWTWARDSYTASIVTDRLLTTDRTAQRSPLPDSVAPPAGGWMTSTPGHLAHWAIFLSRLAGEGSQAPQETADLLERALHASPINATARLALAQLGPPDELPSISPGSLGLSRDSASLAWTARRLMAAGKKEDALKLYGRSLSVALPSESSRAAIPRFSDDPGVPRYLLPGEEQLRDIVRELVSNNAWTFAEWSAVLPQTPIVLIATARQLREQGRGEAEAVLDLILAEKSIPKDLDTTGPVTLAARAEACALRSRWNEADQLYRRAIESIDDATIQRSWWFNLADISFRLNDETQRQLALRAALAVASSDDITRRATDIQRATRARPATRSPGVKAN